VEEIPPVRRRTRHFSGKRKLVRHGELGCEGLLLETTSQLRAFAEAIGVPMATMCLSWLVAQPGVSSVIVGARDPAQVEKNVAAAGLDIGPAAVAQLNEITFPLKQRLGANADLWQGAEDSRIR